MTTCSNYSGLACMWQFPLTTTAYASTFANAFGDGRFGPGTLPNVAYTTPHFRRYQAPACFWCISGVEKTSPQLKAGWVYTIFRPWDAKMGIPDQNLGSFICVQPLNIGFRLSMALRRCFNPAARFPFTSLIGPKDFPGTGAHRQPCRLCCSQ
jgi:hypothetical protein